MSTESVASNQLTVPSQLAQLTQKLARLQEARECAGWRLVYDIHHPYCQPASWCRPASPRPMACSGDQSDGASLLVPPFGNPTKGGGPSTALSLNANLSGDSTGLSPKGIVFCQWSVLASWLPFLTAHLVLGPDQHN
jgi:hypothetical protein